MAEIISSFLLDPMVSAAIEELTSITIGHIRQYVNQALGVDDEVEKLTNCLPFIEAMLVDAEQIHMRKSLAERARLDLLKDRFYDMEDVLDTWNTARLMKSKFKCENGKALVSKTKVCCFNPLISCFGIKQVVFRHDIASHVRNLNHNLVAFNTIEKYGCNLNVDETAVEKREPKLATTFDLDESEIFGRENEKNSLLSRLLCESSEQNPHILAIVGSGGMGKTTLAHFVCKRGEVLSRFNETIIWISVSNPFDNIRIAKAIIEQLDGSTPNLGDLQSLMQHLCESIVGKKFLLILDDVWSEDYDKNFKLFYTCLKNGCHGSKIIITTRHERVAIAHSVKLDDIITVNKLSEDDCNLMFEKRVLSGDESETLKEIGWKIVEKCQGFPLAIKIIGGLLCFEKSIEKWLLILDSEMWMLKEFEEGKFAPLLLSFNYLPYEAKLCFLYSAVFPRDWELDRNQLINLWMAHGYFGLDNNIEMEEKAKECFDILCARSFFQEFKKDKNHYDDNLKCKMHDIVRVVALFLSRNVCCMPEDNTFKAPNCEKTRHLSFVNQIPEESPFPTIDPTLKKLHTLVIQDAYIYPSINREVPPKYFDDLSFLRALHLNSIDFKVISTNIKMLIHLRFLEISHNHTIEELPNTLSKLYNLQTLKLEYCGQFKRLPKKIGKLLNLRHLVLQNCPEVSSMGEGIEKLTCLQTLTTFVVNGGGKDGICSSLECLRKLNCTCSSLECFRKLNCACSSLECLRKLNCTCSSLECLMKLNRLRHLEIKKLGCVIDVSEVNKAALWEKKNLFILGLDFDKTNVNRDDIPDQDEIILKAIKPPPSLEILKISNYGGDAIYLDWMMSLRALKQLHLSHCNTLECLPPLGKLPYLESLFIHTAPNIKIVSKEFLGIESGEGSSSSSNDIVFPKLKSLQLSWMTGWERWDYGIDEEGVTIMPYLRSLKFVFCSHLQVVPEDLFDRTTLEELSVVNSSQALLGYYKEWIDRREAQRSSTSN